MNFGPEDFYKISILVWIPTFVIFFTIEYVLSLKRSPSIFPLAVLTSAIILIVTPDFGLFSILLRLTGYAVWPFTSDTIRWELAPIIGAFMYGVTPPIVVWFRKWFVTKGKKN